MNLSPADVTLRPKWMDNHRFEVECLDPEEENATWCLHFRANDDRYATAFMTEDQTIELTAQLLGKLTGQGTKTAIAMLTDGVRNWRENEQRTRAQQEEQATIEREPIGDVERIQ